jgi:hypothetical protein
VLIVAEQKLGSYGERTETRRIDGKPGVQVFELTDNSPGLNNLGQFYWY